MRLPMPRTMTGRIALILVVALLLELLGNMAIATWQERELISAEKSRRLAEGLVIAERLAMDTPVAQRQRIVADLRTDGLIFNWVPDTVIADSSASHAQLGVLKRRLAELAPPLARADMRLVIVASPEGKRDLIGTMRIADRSFVTFRVSPYLNAPAPFALVMMLHLLLIGAVFGAAWLVVRAVVRPLRDLADLADATGRGTPPRVTIGGPMEVRRVDVAFAAMQARLLSIMNDHTQALIAVSHDLRTPIQRLRLRAALLKDEEAREMMAMDLADIERFIKSVVSYMHGNAPEEPRLVDVAAIVMTAVDNAADAGAAIDYQGPDELVAHLRPLALKRALGNLIENAIQHADIIRVTLVVQGEEIVLSIEDDGPGIPPADRETACLPFRRLATGQRRGGESTGLGLAITKAAVSLLSGSLRLDQSSLGGLAAAIRLPIGAAR